MTKAATVTRVPEHPPTWASATTVVLALVGLGLSVYLAIEHATSSTTLACPDTGTVNCLKVTTSSYSRVLGIPVAYLGVGYFVVATAVALASLRVQSRAMGLVRVAVAVLGIGFVFYLVWAELFRLHAICLWCTGVHVITFLLFAVTLLGEALRVPEETTTWVKE